MRLIENKMKTIGDNGAPLKIHKLDVTARVTADLNSGRFRPMFLRDLQIMFFCNAAAMTQP